LRRWRLGDEEFTEDRYVNRRDIATFRSPSVVAKLEGLFAAVEHLLDGEA